MTGLLFSFLLGHNIPLVQKVLSFVVGVTTTYLFNSRLTFSASYSWGRFCSYLAFYMVGMIVNLGVFLLLVHLLPDLMALAGATAVAAVANYLGARRALSRE